LVTCDTDHWVHKYKTDRGRNFQLLMFIEVKTHGADLSTSQQDTLHIVNQLMRNRRETPTAKLPRSQVDGFTHKVFSKAGNMEVVLKALGGHTLQMSGSSPDSSEWMKWDGRPITEDELTKLLRFDLDPDRPSRPLDLRKHHTVPSFDLFNVIKSHSIEMVNGAN
jgi:hypothetical protein